MTPFGEPQYPDMDLKSMQQGHEAEKPPARKQQPFLQEKNVPIKQAEPSVTDNPKKKETPDSGEPRRLRNLRDTERR